MTEATMELGKVMLTRTLERDGTTVVVRIGEPVPFTKGEPDSYVPFQIGDDEVQMAGGIDGVQALMFALATIGDLLESEAVTLLGMEGSGFPVTEPEEGTYVATLRVPMDMSLLEGSA
jgi:hypothetical protein